MRKNFVYTQTRLQARHGLRPDERTWGLIESQKDLGNFLQSARQSRFSYWVTGLQATNHHHFIESTLLKHYRNYVNEVAGWVPSSWRKSVQWIECLSYLPVLHHLEKGNTAYSWMLEDSNTKLASTTSLDQRIAYLMQSDFAPLFKFRAPGNTLPDVWLEHWRRLWPDKSRSSVQQREHFIRFVQGHRDSFIQLPVNRSWRQRQHLSFKLNMMFRREAFTPINVFVHLLLVALDVERLRAGIIQRNLFSEVEEVAG